MQQPQLEFELSMPFPLLMLISYATCMCNMPLYVKEEIFYLLMHFVSFSYIVYVLWSWKNKVQKKIVWVSKINSGFFSLKYIKCKEIKCCQYEANDVKAGVKKIKNNMGLNYSEKKNSLKCPSLLLFMHKTYPVFHYFSSNWLVPNLDYLSWHRKFWTATNRNNF